MGEICTKADTPSSAKKDPKIYSIEINGVIYEVINGDMCYEHVDAIVNSANAQLNHNTGISGSIVLKGGNEIQVESRNIVEEKGTLAIGEVVTTGSGKLNCKHVIHAVLPIWIGGDMDEEAKLIEAIKNTLQKADELKVQSIAFPALGGGLFGFPRDMAAEITVHNCVEYFKENKTSSIKLVKFMNFDLPTHELRKYQNADTNQTQSSRKPSKSGNEALIQKNHEEIKAQPVTGSGLSEEHHASESHALREQDPTTTVYEQKHEERKEMERQPVNEHQVENTEHHETVKVEHHAEQSDSTSNLEVKLIEEIAQS